MLRNNERRITFKLRLNDRRRIRSIPNPLQQELYSAMIEFNVMACDRAKSKLSAAAALATSSNFNRRSFDLFLILMTRLDQQVADVPIFLE